MRTVFHLIADDEKTQKTGLTITRNLSEDETVEMDDIAVVAQADGIEPLTKGGENSDMVESLIADGISVKACSNTLEMMELDESDLVDGVETVTSGVGELTRLEDDGYAYIRP